MSENQKFEFTYKAPDKRELRQIARIKAELAVADEDMQRLKELRKKIYGRPKLICTLLGVAGTLVFGTGMALILSYDKLAIGIVVGAIGMATTLFVYPIYCVLSDRQKKKYADELRALLSKIEEERR